jgi:MYXO-CTERM domain-containing protein
MRHQLIFVSLFLGTVAASPGLAAVTEPNGTVVPRNPGGGYSETTLDQFFQSEQETGLDWIQDARTIPAVFSPLCGFTAKFVLNQAGLRSGVGWYNADPSATQPPTAAEIFTLIPAGQPVGTVATSSDIRNSPNYRGGLIGFALLAQQIHYSEQKWNVNCPTCQNPGPWALALVYQSVKIPNAYYLAFEDGPVTSAPTGFNNDGDFNDSVFLLTGLVCSGAGDVCQTGQQGVCNAGVTDCDTTGTLGCKQNIQASAEVCDGLDNNCNGQIDDNAACPTNFVCDRGVCVRRCAAGEFPCPGNTLCNSRGFCVEPGCENANCSPGQVCRDGICRGACENVVCPLGQECRLDRCVDPCQGVTCGSNQVCQRGVCVNTCDCQPCTTGLACNMTSGQCVDPTCVNVTCGPGTSCRNGTCVDNCTGTSCPPNQYCVSSQCVDISTIDGGIPDIAVPRDLSGSTDDGPGTGGIDLRSGDGGGGGIIVASGGCGCHIGVAQNDRVGLLGVASFLLALVWRRRRSALKRAH